MTTLLMNIIRGASTVIDIAPLSNRRRKKAYPHASEESALRQDWAQVGDDLWTAMNRMDENVETTKEQK